MDPRPITPSYYVSPQISAQHMPAIAQAGFGLVICNRPDSEVGDDLKSDLLRAAAGEAGLRFEVLELTHQTLTPENAAIHRELIESADGNVLAYCRSGTRSSVIWALAHLNELGVDGVLARARAAGYDLEKYRPLFEQAAAGAG